MKNFSIDDLMLVQNYINENSDKPIQMVYIDLKKKKFKERSRAENIVFAYLKLNKRKLGIRD